MLVGASYRSRSIHSSARRGAQGSRRPVSTNGPSSSRGTRPELFRHSTTCSTSCFLDAEKDDYEELFALARDKVEPGALIVADNVLSHDELHSYSAARQADPTLESVTVPLDRGIELSVVLTAP